MWLVVGLGNPGSKYQWTRHNIGFLAIDFLANKLKIPLRADKIVQAQTAKVEWDGTPVLLVQPLTFMNLSGQAIRPLIDYYRIATDHVVILHDEVDLPFGSLKVQTKRGPGGHNGIKSVHQHLGTDEYFRIRMGVGRPSGPEDVANFVLHNFASAEKALLEEFIGGTCDAVHCLIQQGYNKAATQFNRAIVTPPERAN